MGYVGYIAGLVFVALAYWITYRNSPKYANILLGIVVLSIIIAQIKPIQMLSVLGFFGVLAVMVMSRFAREKEISGWFREHHFRPTQFLNASNLFSHNPNTGSIIYHNYLTNINGINCLYSEQYNSYNSGNNPSLVVHCSYYFNGKLSVDELERKFIVQKEKTEKTGFIESQLGYFDLKDCTIFRPNIGGVAVSWRFPTTIEGYNTRYEWIKEALAN